VGLSGSDDLFAWFQNGRLLDVQVEPMRVEGLPDLADFGWEGGGVQRLVAAGEVDEDERLTAQGRLGGGGLQGRLPFGGWQVCDDDGHR
jgi:hypothetical protein